MWFLGVVLNGLLLVSYEPFHSEEACRIAAKQLPVEEFSCIAAPEPELPQ